MIYPTRRAIYLLLLGAPVALALGLLRPDLWLVALGWIALVAVGLLLDTLTGAAPRKLALDAQFPLQIGVGDREVPRHPATVPGRRHRRHRARAVLWTTASPGQGCAQLSPGDS